MPLRRVFSLVLMIATMTAPLSLALCRVECASAGSGQTAVHHSCHQESAPAAVKMTAVPHACGHSDDAPAGLEQALQTVAAPVAIMPAAVWIPTPRLLHAAGIAGADTSPPPVTRPIQLRV